MISLKSVYLIDTRGRYLGTQSKQGCTFFGFTNANNATYVTKAIENKKFTIKKLDDTRYHLKTVPRPRLIKLEVKQKDPDEVALLAAIHSVKMNLIDDVQVLTDDELIMHSNFDYAFDIDDDDLKLDLTKLALASLLEEN